MRGSSSTATCLAWAGFNVLGGRLEVCSSCFEEYCRDLPKDERGRPQLRPGTSIHSLGIVAERVGSMPIVTF